VLRASTCGKNKVSTITTGIMVQAKSMKPYPKLNTISSNMMQAATATCGGELCAAHPLVCKADDALSHEAAALVRALHIGPELLQAPQHSRAHLSAQRRHSTVQQQRRDDVFITNVVTLWLMVFSLPTS
jgi:hypothetical protein